MSHHSVLAMSPSRMTDGEQSQDRLMLLTNQRLAVSALTNQRPVFVPSVCPSGLFTSGPEHCPQLQLGWRQELYDTDSPDLLHPDTTRTLSRE